MRALSGETSDLLEGADPQRLQGYQANLIYSILDQQEEAFGKRMMPETVGKTLVMAILEDLLVLSR